MHYMHCNFMLLFPSASVSVSAGAGHCRPQCAWLPCPDDPAAADDAFIVCLLSTNTAVHTVNMLTTSIKPAIAARIANNRHGFRVCATQYRQWPQLQAGLVHIKHHGQRCAGTSCCSTCSVEPPVASHPSASSLQPCQIMHQVHLFLQQQLVMKLQRQHFTRVAAATQSVSCLLTGLVARSGPSLPYP